MTKQRRIKIQASVVILLFLFASLGLAGLSDKDKASGLQKTNSNDIYRAFLINNVFNYYGNNGDGSYNKFSSDNEGFEFPKGTGKHVIFEDGVVWGGYHKGRLVGGLPAAKVGGSVYRHGLQAGKILTYGTPTSDPQADDPSLGQYRVFRVRPDINPNTPYSEVEGKINSTEIPFIGRYESYSAQDLYNQYIQDWNEWPASDGAPFKDENGDGVYDPKVDIPGQPGSDQTLFYVANDMSSSRTTQLAGSPPIGLEMRRTIWGYNRAGALGFTIFASTILINKSGAPIDTMYLVQWSDPDLGDAGDDFAGCDTARSLGYIYNSGVDKIYGTAVPAGGFTFFQGPIVQGAATDTAIFQLHYRPGFKNLKMSAFAFFTQGIPAFTDPKQGVGGDIEWYNLMKGTIAASGSPFIDPNTNQPTKFCFAGDPVTGTGWNDGGAIPAQDRRICLVTGPFTMAAGDTQELVVANLAGLGADRLSSVTVMRGISDKAQQAYNGLFVLPGPPPIPQVTVANLNNEVVLNWGDPAAIAKTEGAVDQGYTFQGYNVYELAGPSFTNPILLGTWDLNDGVKVIADTVFDALTGLNMPVVLQKGSDNGVIHTLDIKTSKVTSQDLVNNNKYYFAVTAYSYNANPPAASGTHSLESPATVLTAVPQSVPPGVRYPAPVGQVDTAVHVKGPSNGAVYATVVAPQLLTGATYKVIFDTLHAEPVWHLLRQRGSVWDTVARNQTDQSLEGPGPITVDGLQWKVVGAPNDFAKFIEVANGKGPLATPDMATFAFNSSGFPTLDGLPPAADNSNSAPSANQQVGGGQWGICTGMSSSTMSASYSNFLSRVMRNDNFSRVVPFDFEIRFTAAGGKGEMAFTSGTMVDIPFELWNIGSGTPTDASDDYRLIPWINDVNGDEKFGLDSVDHSISGGDNDPETDWIYWYSPVDKAPGQAGYNAWVATNPQDDSQTDAELMARMVLVEWNGGSISDPTFPANCKQTMMETGTILRILTTKPNNLIDEFTLVAPTVTQSADLAKQDIQLVNVFPNPYIGFNPQETDKYNRYVTFTHLPKKATIRIFNLAGILVRSLAKDDNSQFTQWNLKNDAGFPASAGMYIVYIDMPDLGQTKILKLGVIPEQQYIDRW